MCCRLNSHHAIMACRADYYKQTQKSDAIITRIKNGSTEAPQMTYWVTKLVTPPRQTDKSATTVVR